MSWNDGDSPIVVVSVGALLVLAVLGMGIGLDAARCDSMAKQMGHDSNYGPLQGCMFKADGRWVPVDTRFRPFGGSSER
jgi:hypothetical protein